METNETMVTSNDFNDLRNLIGITVLPVEKADVTAIGVYFHVWSYVVVGVFLCYRCYSELARARARCIRRATYKYIS